MKHLAFCTLLCFSISICTLSAAAAHPFTDTSGHWAEPQIETWTQRGVVQGNQGNFHPNDSITRGAVAAIIDRIQQYPTTAAHMFSDLAPDAYCAGSIQRLYHAGIMQGYEDGTVHPNAPISRQEAVVLLARAFHLSSDSTAELPYTDSNNISAFALDAVRAFTEKGYVHGNKNHQFRPKAPISRAEFVTILDNMIAAIYPKDSHLPDKLNDLLVVNQAATVSDVEVESIFVAPGVGEDTVALHNVAADTLYVLGGGLHSIVITGNSQIRSIQINKQDSGVRIAVEGNAAAEIVYIEDGCDDVILTGNFQTVVISSDKNTVQLKNAVVKNLIITGKDARVVIDKESSVTTLTVTQNAENAVVDSDGKIDSVQVDNPSATVNVPNNGSSDSDSGSSGGSSSGNSGSSDETPTNVFGMTIRVSGKGTIFAEEVDIGQTPEPDPDPDPDEPELIGYPLVIQTDGHGFAVAMEVEYPAPPPSAPMEPKNEIVRINIAGQGTVLIQKIGE